MHKILGTLIITLSVVFIFVFSSVISPSLVFAQDGLVTCTGAEDCTFDSLLSTLGEVVTFLLKLAVSIAVIIFAYAGFLYLSAAGDSSKITKAHNLMWSAVVGFFIAISAWLIVEAVLNTFEVKPEFSPF